jgi:hypothetical protein
MLPQSSKAVLAAAVMASSAMLAPSAAEAGRRTGTWRYGPPAHYQPHYGAGYYYGPQPTWKAYHPNPNAYRGVPGVYGGPAYYGYPQPPYGRHRR